MSTSPEILIETDNVRVRIMSLDQGQATAWHYHTAVTDKMLCLEGPVAVEYRGPDERVELRDGENCEVVVGRVHRVVNLADRVARYLLVQGVGRYDFNITEE